MFIKTIEKLFRRNLDNDIEFELVLYYVSDVYGACDMSVKLTSELTDLFLREYPNAKVLKEDNEYFTIVGWEVYRKYSEKLREQLCNCKIYEYEIYARIVEEAILSVIKKLGLEILKQEKLYKDTYLKLEIRKNKLLDVFERVVDDIRSIGSGSDPRWARIDRWIDERIEYWKKKLKIDNQD